MHSTNDITFREVSDAESTAPIKSLPALAEPVRLLLMTDNEPPKRDSSWLSNFVAVGLSVLFHVWLIVTLSGIAFDEPERIDFDSVDTSLTNDPVEESVDEPRQFELANPQDRDLESVKSVTAVSIGQEFRENPQQESTLVLHNDHELSPGFRSLPRLDVPQGVEVSKTIVVPGSTGEAFIQIEGALDRVTWEIAANLKEKKLLVVWMIDGSASLVPQRDAVAKRLRRIYGELNALETADQIPKVDRPILSGVVAFGSQTSFVTKEPTDKFEEVLQAFKAAPIDPSGVENVFTAVCQVLDRWQKYRFDHGRRFLIITITDEAGDDHGTPLETAIVKCQRLGAKAYVIGPAAPFGRRKGYVPYVAKENGKTYQLPVDLGPETVVVENMDLPFWYDGPQYTYLSSGFGPYALTRLVKETGGAYYLSNMTTMAGLNTTGTFDPALMKSFEPDYRYGSPSQFLKDISKHPLRAAVYAAADFSQTTQIHALGTPQMEFRVQPNNFRQVFADAQKSVAISSFTVESILSKIPPQVEKWYASEPSMRWRLAYDLNYGRLLAQHVRTMEYNLALAQLKSTYSDSDISKKVNHFILRPDHELHFATNLKRQSKTAEQLLRRVLDDAPGTPWALMAARELKDGFGIKVIERFIPPPPPPPPAKPGAPQVGPKIIQPPQPNVPQKPAPKPPEPVLPKL